MKELALIVNTVDKNKDIWPMFFEQMKAHTTNSLFSSKYVFVNETEENLPEDYKAVYFNAQQNYKNQFVSCISNVKESYCIYIGEDYILYDDVREDLIQKYMDVLDNNSNLSFIRFMKGGVVSIDSPNYKDHADLFQLHHSFPYFYTGQAALWRTRDLEKIHQHGPELHIGNKDWQNSFEFQATKTCQELDIQGVYCYHGEPKRGVYHYDSVVFPHISTALVKGKWNVAEYPARMTRFFERYDINVNERGVS